MMRKYGAVVCGLVVLLFSGACRGKEWTVQMPGVEPCSLTEEEENILEVFDMMSGSKIFSFYSPEGAESLEVAVYRLDEDGKWRRRDGGGISLTADAGNTEEETVREGTFALEIRDDRSVAFHIRDGGLFSYETEPLFPDLQILGSSTAFLEEFRKMDLDEETPVAVMVWDGGTEMTSCTPEDYFRPEKFSDMDLVQAVTLKFSSQPEGDGAGWENGEEDDSGEPSEGGEDTLPEVISGKENSGAPEKMTLYSACPFSFAGIDWNLCLYAEDGMVWDGELAVDDRCRFVVRAENEDRVFDLLDDTVQLGVPAADVWTDLENRLHITVRDVRTARYRVGDYVYDEEKQEFRGQPVMDWDGVNVIGSVGEGKSTGAGKTEAIPRIAQEEAEFEGFPESTDYETISAGAVSQPTEYSGVYAGSPVTFSLADTGDFQFFYVRYEEEGQPELISWAITGEDIRLSCGIHVGMTAEEAQEKIPGLFWDRREAERASEDLPKMSFSRWNTGAYPDGWCEQFAAILISEVDYGGEMPRYLGLMLDEQDVIRAITFEYPTAG